MALQRQHEASRPVVAPADEQPFAPAGAAAPLVRRGSGGRVADSAAARALAKLPRRGSFVPRKLACDPRFEPHNRRRLEWLRKRRTELAAMTGAVSHAVGAMLASAAWLYAAGEFAAEMGAEGGVVFGEPDYYVRFCFEAVPGLELRGVPPEYFQCLAFGGRKPPRGTVAYHPAFDLA